MALQPCSLAPIEVAQALRTHCVEGLTPEEAARRLVRRGPNRTPLVLPSPLRTFALGTLRCRVSTAFLIAGSALYTAWYPFERSAFIWAAMIIALALQGVVDFRSKRAVATLAQGALQSQPVLVQRGGHAVIVPWHCVVCGDVLLLRAGQRIAGDARLIESLSLKVSEELLLCDDRAVAIAKDATAVLAADTCITQQQNMVFAHTRVVCGEGRALVVATGANTEVHRAHLLAINAHEPNAQLQVQVDRLTWRLCALGFFGVLVVAALGWWRDYDMHLLLVGSLILAFATIPQGLPVLAQAVLGSASLALAADSNILVKKLATAAELGSITAVVTDKTATLTENRLTLDVVGMYDRLTERQRMAPLAGNEVAYLRSLMHCWTLSAPPLSLPAAHVFQSAARAETSMATAMATRMGVGGSGLGTGGSGANPNANPFGAGAAKRALVFPHASSSINSSLSSSDDGDGRDEQYGEPDGTDSGSFDMEAAAASAAGVDFVDPCDHALIAFLAGCGPSALRLFAAEVAAASTTRYDPLALLAHMRGHQLQQQQQPSLYMQQQLLQQQQKLRASSMVAGQSMGVSRGSDSGSEDFLNSPNPNARVSLRAAPTTPSAGLARDAVLSSTLPQTPQRLQRFESVDSDDAAQTPTPQRGRLKEKERANTMTGRAPPSISSPSVFALANSSSSAVGQGFASPLSPNQPQQNQNQPHALPQPAQQAAQRSSGGSGGGGWTEAVIATFPFDEQRRVSSVLRCAVPVGGSGGDGDGARGSVDFQSGGGGGGFGDVALNGGGVPDSWTQRASMYGRYRASTVAEDPTSNSFFEFGGGGFGGGVGGGSVDFSQHQQRPNHQMGARATALQPLLGGTGFSYHSPREFRHLQLSTVDATPSPGSSSSFLSLEPSLAMGHSVLSPSSFTPAGDGGGAHGHQGGLMHAANQSLNQPYNAMPSMPYSLYVRGAPEAVVARCVSVELSDGQSVALPPASKLELLRHLATMASAARVLAVARRRWALLPVLSIDRLVPDDIERDLVFVGFFAFADPVRDEAAAAVDELVASGIVVKLASNDHQETCMAVARQLGISARDYTSPLVLDGAKGGGGNGGGGNSSGGHGSTSAASALLGGSAHSASAHVASAAVGFAGNAYARARLDDDEDAEGTALVTASTMSVAAATGKSMSFEGNPIETRISITVPLLLGDKQQPQQQQQQQQTNASRPTSALASAVSAAAATAQRPVQRGGGTHSNVHASTSSDSSSSFYLSGATSSPSLPHSGGDALDDDAFSSSSSSSVGGGREWSIDGAALAKASDSQLTAIALQNSVFSRTPAAQRCRLVAALRAAGHGVLVTGDGADDCAALDAAQVGCAMGRLGTDAVQEMAGLVLMQNSRLDGDNTVAGGADHDTASSTSLSSSSSLTNVVRAIRAGRAMAANLTRSFAFSVGCKFALLVSAITALALGYPLPLASMHWIVLSALTDSIAATAFTHVTTDRKLGQRRLGPAPIGGRAEGREPPAFFGAAFRVRAATSAAVVAGAALLAMQLSLVWLPTWRGQAAFVPAPGAYPTAAVVGQMQTMVFVATTVSIMLLAWSMVASPPSSSASGWCRGSANFGNGAHIVLWWTSGIVACLAIAFLARPTREVLSLNSLVWAQVACAVGAPIAVVAVMAAMRAIVRRCEGADGMAAGGCAAAFAANDDADS